MTSTRVSRLHLRLDNRDTGSRAQFLVEEALRLSSQDAGSRLVVIRELNLGRIDQNLNLRASELLRALITNAVAAESAASARADAVFFPSQNAARAALLQHLLRGVVPIAWFWQKAVPEWQGDSAAAVSRLMQILQSTPQGRITLGKSILNLLNAGAFSSIIRHIEWSEARKLLAIWPGLNHPTVTEASYSKPHGMNGAMKTPGTAARSDDVRIDRSRAHVLAVQQALPVGHPLRRWLMLMLFIAERPDLADSPALVATIVAERDAAAARHLHRAHGPAPDFAADVADHASLQVKQASQRLEAQSTASQPDKSATLQTCHEQRSVAAGLFYCLRLLQRLGYAAWLEHHPAEAEQQHGLHLLRFIAEHQKIPTSDPVWSLLPLEANTELDLRPWRIALDRWLRRSCRLNLARAVKRTGWITASDEHISVRFPLDDADVRLRRHGIDLDPGFVAWLGRSVSFKFEDRL